VAGVDTAEQRLDEPVDDLLAEPLLHQRPDARVAALERGRREDRVHRRPGETRLRDHPALGEHLQIGGDAHQGARHRQQLAARPEVRRGVRRVHEVVAETGGPGQLDGLRPPVQHRLGADVDDHAADLTETQLAADLARGLEHDDVGVRALRPHLGRGGQAGDATADDDDGRVRLTAHRRVTHRRATHRWDTVCT
jgi:hypothetical protein